VSEMDIIIVFTVLGAIIAGVTSQRLTLLFGRESGEEVTPAFLLAGFLLVAPAVYAVLKLLVSLLELVFD